ncbi:tRNA (adenosine(37)-N6)-threonylcarbamoyltransferase complex transferase subunit TsaD [Candidatus Nomurabacteria bacterium]|nr:tRNA (adenosine(37)-N6)-threonylcarbamoyltransferase complex transferase subunit TsaD [Candidatus Nomurabacteria bacterium]
MRILALESSCDETALAIISGSGSDWVLEKDIVYSQIAIHQKYGGVVPEVAARKHAETIFPLLTETLGEEKLATIDYLAVTAGPGLVASLLLGVTAARSLAYAAAKPLLPVNHMEGHIYSNWLSNSELKNNDQKYFPSLALVVSGGHTELVLMKNHGDYQLLGTTQDDAVGEAFDKVAKILNLGYPGGPIVSKEALEGDDQAYKLPRPMLNSGDYNFSFSGLKTAVLYTLEREKNISQAAVKNICASFQAAAVELLVKKTIKAAQEFQVKSIMIAGGVSANQLLREELKKESTKISLPLFYPELKYTGDNAAMIAVAAYYGLQNKNKKILKGEEIFSAKPLSNWQIFLK